MACGCPYGSNIVIADAEAMEFIGTEPGGYTFSLHRLFTENDEIEITTKPSPDAPSQRFTVVKANTTPSANIPVLTTLNNTPAQAYQLPVTIYESSKAHHYIGDNHDDYQGDADDMKYGDHTLEQLKQLVALLILIVKKMKIIVLNDNQKIQ